MCRIEKIGNAVLYLGDCLEILPSIQRIDAVVTDPPYNVGMEYENHDDRMPPRDYLRWLRQCFEACAAAGATQILWFWQGIRVAKGEALVCLPEGWKIHHLCTWHKREFAGDLWKGNHPAYSWEPIIWAAPKAAAAYGGPIGGHAARDCIVANQSRHDGYFDHPCYKTLSVVRAAVQWVKAEIIADIYMGSGTTGVATVQAGRRFIGIEKSPRYFAQACKRIEQAQRQGRLIA
jgi:site-specific DNA-methyltransferase (adenine-specific)